MGLFARRSKKHRGVRENIPEATEEAVGAIEAVQPYTMTGVERLWAMWQAMHHAAAVPLQGDIVECGVWRGGNLILAGLICERLGLDRTIYGFDTYAGMSEPTAADVNFGGVTAVSKFQSLQRADHNEWCYASLDDVRANIAATTSYPRYRLIVGKCEETLQDPANLPERIAVLRLDTDWYESTKVELEQLYPRLVSGGILIIDDYGHWGGARQAVDEYFAGAPVLLTRVDYTARMLVKA